MKKELHTVKGYNETLVEENKKRLFDSILRECKEQRLSEAFILKARSGKYIKSPWCVNKSPRKFTENPDEAFWFDDDNRAIEYIYDMYADGYDLGNHFIKVDAKTGEEIEDVIY